MGLLFENMQKMDIQAERKRTEDAIVYLCQKHGDTKQEAVETLMKMREMSQTEAEEIIEHYWKV